MIIKFRLPTVCKKNVVTARVEPKFIFNLDYFTFIALPQKMQEAR